MKHLLILIAMLAMIGQSQAAQNAEDILSGAIRNADAKAQGCIESIYEGDMLESMQLVEILEEIKKCETGEYDTVK